MIITPVRTHKITSKDKSIFEIFDKYIKEFKERSVLVVTSKIVSILEGRIVPISKTTKDELVKKEAQFYIPRSKNKYNICTSITYGKLISSAGIDESNGAGNYVLWPKNPQKSANQIRKYLIKRFKVKYSGVLIIDSHTVPLRPGVSGFTLAHSGFLAIKRYIGKPDLFGRAFHMTNQSIIDGLAASSSVVMGEGNEQTPLAIVSDIPFVDFQSRNPTKRGLNNLKIRIEDDIYSLLLSNVPWEKGYKG